MFTCRHVIITPAPPLFIHIFFLCFLPPSIVETKIDPIFLGHPFTLFHMSVKYIYIFGDVFGTP